jgi:hypothetical protein
MTDSDYLVAGLIPVVINMFRLPEYLPANSVKVAFEMAANNDNRYNRKARTGH